MDQTAGSQAVTDAPISIIAPTIDLTPEQAGRIDLTANQTIDLQQAEAATGDGATWNTTPITGYPHSTVAEIRALMDRFTISGVPIVDALGRLVGIVTRRDLRFLSPSEEQNTMLNIMTRNVVKVPEGTSIAQARTVLHEHRIERVPMVDQHDNLLGMLSAHDFFAGDRMAQAVPVTQAESGYQAKHRLRVSERAAQGVAASIPYGPNIAEQVRTLTFNGVNSLVIEGVNTPEASAEIAELRAAYAAVRFIEVSA